MIGYVMVGTNNLDNSIKFYDELLKVIGLTRVDKDEVCAGYASKDSPGAIEFYITLPVNKKKATIGNGTMVTFIAKSKKIVDEFYKIGIALGAKDEGKPGPRHGKDYYAYLRDLDGNKICVCRSITIKN